MKKLVIIILLMSPLSLFSGVQCTLQVDPNNDGSCQSLYRPDGEGGLVLVSSRCEQGTPASTGGFNCSIEAGPEPEELGL